MDHLVWLCDQPPFSLLGPPGRTELARNLEVTYLPAGSFVGRRGTTLDHVWVVRRGAVRRHQPGPDVVIEEGEAVGAVEALAGLIPGTGDASGPRPPAPLTADHEVIEDTLAVLVPVASFRRLAADEAFRTAVERRSRPDRSGLTVDVHAVAGPASWIDADRTVGEAARLMDDRRTDAVLVRWPDDEGLGILTARDLRSRVLAVDRGPETTVADVATERALMLDPSTPLTDAIVFLVEHDIHHAPVGEGDTATALLSNHDILAHHGSDAFSLLRRMSRGGGHDLATFGDRVTDTVRAMLAADVGPGAIGRSVSSLVDGLMRSLCREAEEELGPPPVPYALCACGSQGRREQTLLTDQDNLLVWGDGGTAPADDSATDEEARVYFSALAERVVSGITSAGIPECSGGHMATNWHGSLRWWRRLVAGWARDPGPEALLDINIVADLRPVHGELPAEELLRPLHQAMSSTQLVSRLGAEVIRFRPPGRLSRLFGRGEDFEVKRHGLIPIVGLGRLFALELALPASSTRQRMAAGAEAGLISADAEVWLADGLDFLTGVRLEGQLRSLAATGDTKAIPVRRDDLDPMARSTLREVLRVIADVQETTSRRLHLDAVG